MSVVDDSAECSETRGSVGGLPRWGTPPGGLHVSKYHCILSDISFGTFQDQNCKN